jgi:hypothetical protein
MTTPSTLMPATLNSKTAARMPDDARNIHQEFDKDFICTKRTTTLRAMAVLCSYILISAFGGSLHLPRCMY